jgi:hypothetical protein
MHLCDVMIISYMVMKRHKFDVNFFFLVNWVAISNEAQLEAKTSNHHISKEGTGQKNASIKR